MEVLIVEDDDAVGLALQAALKRTGHQSTRVSLGADALLRHRTAEVILLDLGLPDMDGLEVLQKLRQLTAVPVLILTARDDERNVVRGLRQGADDYLVKPVKLGELLARIEAVARRSRPPAAVDELLVHGPVEVNPASHEASVSGRPVSLTRTEYKVLEILLRARGAVVSRARLKDEIWGDAFLGASRSLDVHLTGLRTKLCLPGIIQNVRGVGYRLGETGQP